MDTHCGTVVVSSPKCIGIHPRQSVREAPLLRCESFPHDGPWTLTPAVISPAADSGACAWLWCTKLHGRGSVWKKTTVCKPSTAQGWGLEDLEDTDLDFEFREASVLTTDTAAASN